MNLEGERRSLLLFSLEHAHLLTRFFTGGALPALPVNRWRVLAQWQAGRDSSSGMFKIVKALRA